MEKTRLGLQTLRFGALLSFALLWAATASAQVELVRKSEANGQSQAISDYGFRYQIDLETNPVCNQGKTGTCWSFSSVGFLESEYLRKEKSSIDLSEMYVVRKVYEDKAEKYLRMHGTIAFAQGGALPDMLYVLREYGMMPETAYPGRPNPAEGFDHSELESALKGLLDAVLKAEGKSLSQTWQSGVQALLDAYLGAVPETFEYEGKRYTARTFADQKLKLKAEEYVQITSFTHRPEGTWMAIEVPDNWLWDRSFNVSLEGMMKTLNRALDAGMSVGWATDVSEKSFAVRKGLAVCPDPEWLKTHPEATGFEFQCPERTIDPALRQLGYDRWETTDDHGMLITGKAQAADDRVFYLVKNSWGEIENPVRPGYLMASEAFVEYKTISMLLPVEALSKEDRKKAGL